VVEVLAARSAASFKKARRFIRAQVAETRLADRAVVLALPTTFMNEAGQAVSPLARYYSASSDGLLIVHDDIDLPFGKLRASFDRGPGGNNGVRSVIRALGTREFWRLKCGVGRPPGRMDPADFVLRPFTKSERPEVDLMVQYAADVVEVFVTEGGDAARQRAGEIGATD
jgi:PTH1 family peptidyl-tRNA hydrolase